MFSNLPKKQAISIEFGFNLGKMDLVRAAVGPLSSAMIPTMSYIYSEDNLLEQVIYLRVFKNIT